MAKAKGGLGKGLEALFADNSTDEAAVSTLAVSEIEPNRGQPRKQFDPAALADLADSIRQHGVLQPLVVRPMPDGSYQLVAGERRWRAARMAGLSQVPVVIKELSDSETMALALIENLQREDLNAIEEAMGYRDLMENFGLTQEQVSAKVGKSRPVVTNALRLLGLPEEVRGLLSEGKLSAGHARALLSLGEEELIRQAAADTVKKGLSVRQVEALAKRQKQQKAASKPQNAWDQSFFAEVELALSQCLARKVKVEGENGRGRLVIEFYDEDDLRSIASSLEKSGG
ncbi:ParB/RepB/Spo0J family partition protein [Anaerotruncus sp. DFI.9.16]|uniref:ParB/RepB/Spo0J family partition protein n=1 Tax=Anaerotruncus sp. DFI.9.16 TaxID=2965275 RepID=UPI00210B9B75|nr:ParB/RepB/Spo0J family partition protein [Anaerotruncus sp. DFI.9.16]MCQ4897461.1 ParB/RepB/Spo0J family partition protein [Anaerotruncus sp. DFI.9.16]